MTRIFAALAAMAAALFGSVPAAAYPTRPVTIIVPFAAGGPSDAIARLLAQSLSTTLGQQVVVENVAGAGGTAGAARLAAAAPDGHTLLVHHVALTAGAALYPNLAYDTRTAFEPLGLINYGPFVLTAKKGFPANSLAELLERLRRDGEKVSMAHAGIGSGSHLCGMMLTHALRAKVTFVPYRGTGPAMNDLLGGQVDVLCDQTTNALPQIQARTIQAYAVTSPAPIAQLPTLPTVASAVPGFELSVWHALYAPRGTPEAVIARLNRALQTALADPGILARFEALGTLTFPADQRSPAAHRAKLEAELLRWAAVVREAGVAAQ